MLIYFTVYICFCYKLPQSFWTIARIWNFENIFSNGCHGDYGPPKHPHLKGKKKALGCSPPPFIL